MSFLDFIPLIGDIAEGLLGSSAQSSANKTNIKLQRSQQDWERDMSNTAMQRRVDDLRKAGLNPVLAAGGQGASTPSVSPATVESTYKPTGKLGANIQSAMMLNAQRKLLEAQTTAADATGGNQHEQARGNKITNDLAEYGYIRGSGEGYDNSGGYAAKEREAGLAGRISDNRIKAIEAQVAEATSGYKISSAQRQNEILTKQVGFEEAKAELEKLRIPEAKAMAKWFETVGAGSPAAKAVMSISQWLKFILRR